MLSPTLQLLKFVNYVLCYTKYCNKIKNTSSIKYINQDKKNETMRTLDSNQLTSNLRGSKSYTWNTKRRYK